MRKLLLKAVIVFVVIHLLGIFSCGDEDCGKQSYYRVLDLFLTNVNKELSTINRYERLEDETTISYRLYAIGLTHGLEYYSHSQRYNDFFFYPRFKDPFTYTAIACDPLMPNTEESTTSIVITSDQDFISSNDTILAGQSLNDIFQIDFNGVESLSLTSFLSSSSSVPYEHAVFLFLNTPPSENQMHRFSVFYELDNVVSHRATTNPIIISP